MEFDCVVVGAGFAGAVCAERLANTHGKRVLVVERRGHLGGFAHDRDDENGILVHRHGPHIFHTKSAEVWNYLSRFTDWRLFDHHVLASIDGRLVPLPFNLNSLHALFPLTQAARIEAALLARFGPGARVPIHELRREGEGDLKALADFVHEKVFRAYTIKQWGLPLEQLPPSVAARVPVVVSRDDRYFDDPWQGVPAAGYTRLFERMLDSRNIEVLLHTDYREAAADLTPKTLIYTGMIDEFFDNRFGPLPYRALEFRYRSVSRASFQEAAVVNYPNEHAHTRITEYKKLTGQIAPTTTIVYEVPRPYRGEGDEAYYPIPLEANDALYGRYRHEAQRVRHVRFVGRLAQYTYLNMDQVVAAALRCVDDIAAAR
jgi:UDP-galactopyranose mutase